MSASPLPPYQVEELLILIENLGLALRCMFESGRDEHLGADVCAAGDAVAHELVLATRELKADFDARFQPLQTGSEL